MNGDVLIAVPTRGAIQWATVTRLQEIRDTDKTVPPILYQPGNLSVALTRNKIVRQFLEGRWKYLAMVDDDVVPSPRFLQLKEHLKSGEYGLVGLPHPMPTTARDRLVLGVWQKVNGGWETQDLRPGLNECDAIATGACITTREALQAVGPDPFKMSNDPDFPTSDDFFYCQDLQAAGYKIGCWHDGWFADHQTVVSLAPLFERSHT